MLYIKKVVQSCQTNSPLAVVKKLYISFLNKRREGVPLTEKMKRVEQFELYSLDVDGLHITDQLIIEKPFTEEEVLAAHFTNPGRRVTALTQEVRQVDAGAMMSRFSRSALTGEDLFLKEFYRNPDRGDKFYARVLAEYGDDSVAELGGAHVMCHGVSQLTVKDLEDSRIGISPLEKSTRYVSFAEKKDGKYLYFREPRIMASEHARLYERTCDALFDTHVEAFNTLHDWVVEEYPQQPDESDVAFRLSRKAKALDLTRGLLPAATQTNVGLYGNGRAFEYLLIKLHASPLQESRDVATEMQTELEKVIPAFVRRVREDKYGAAQIAFLRNRDQRVRRVAAELVGHLTPEPAPEVSLVTFASETDQIVSRILYEGCELPLAQINREVQGLDVKDKKRVVDAYLEGRTNRRHKPGRAFEVQPYVFDILADFGIYRDLQRHRMVSQKRQRLTTHNGFDTPAEITNLGLSQDWNDAMDTAKEAFKTLETDFPFEAQYVVPLASNLRWYMGMNPREVFWQTELRTTPQGHPNYRRVVNKMWDLAKERDPLVFDSPIVERNREECEKNYLERQAAQKKIDEKLRKIGEKRS